MIIDSLFSFLCKQPPQIHKVYRVAVAVDEPVCAVADGVYGGEAGSLWIVVSVAVVVEAGSRVGLFAQVAVVGGADKSNFFCRK